jgi:hypothetical protein
MCEAHGGARMSVTLGHWMVSEVGGCDSNVLQLMQFT